MHFDMLLCCIGCQSIRLHAPQWVVYDFEIKYNKQQQQQQQQKIT